MENVFDMTLVIMSKMSFFSMPDLESRTTIMILRRKIPETIRMSHFWNGVDFISPEFSSLRTMTLVMAMMHHPRISVVIIVVTG